ncbi:hypothetical protein THTE_2704 [Thermogutta terrifontis]|uniref:Uncharacterized protein n=1 Tax=Thermogutta terrifontis TaxID=1331910 RepID=A0A286RH99_9BACT|nr:hypothetical protein THTE_2704 [Thermogutta terrifontis]
MCGVGLLLLWFAGNRRSDTLLSFLEWDRHPLWFAGNRRSDTLVSPTFQD